MSHCLQPHSHRTTPLTLNGEQDSHRTNHTDIDQLRYLCLASQMCSPTSFLFVELRMGRAMWRSIVRVRTHALTHSRTHALTHSRTHALTHSRTHALTHALHVQQYFFHSRTTVCRVNVHVAFALTHAHTHAQTRTNTHKHAQTRTNTHNTRTNTHKHAQTRTNTHKHTQTRTHTHARLYK